MNDQEVQVILVVGEAEIKEEGTSMPKKLIQAIERDLNDRLTGKEFLRQMGLKKRTMVDLLKKENWVEGIRTVLLDWDFSCGAVCNCCKKMMGALSAEGEPEGGWLAYAYEFIEDRLFPHSWACPGKREYKKAVLFYLTVLQVFLSYEEPLRGKQRKDCFSFLTKQEAEQWGEGEEYGRFLECFQKNHIYELMRIGQEVTPFDTLGHVTGVHGVAMHVARQLAAAGVPINLGLVSAAAATHDIGKYGCRAHELKRIPYLHYYYTDQWLKQNGLPAVAHIASNHSTWDLELENLPVESLVLIYGDFRVKNGGKTAQGKELIRIFTLQEAFSVILSKLDNVDHAKEDRYRRVYGKLADFEDYMLSLGVNVDLTREERSPIKEKDGALLSHTETVNRLKHMAIAHNIWLMNKLSGDVSFGNVMEAARSERNWKNSRAYINLFEEYFTYMTQKQKLLTLNFLYELLMHKEGDIRRQAADLMGNIIVNFDVEYRKELPEGGVRDRAEVSSLDLWERYLKLIIYPDHKVADQHRRWIGFALKGLVDSVLTRCTAQQRRGYLVLLLKEYEAREPWDSTAFTLIDTALAIPLDLLEPEDLQLLIGFAVGVSSREPLELRTGVLRFMKNFTEQIPAALRWQGAVEKTLRYMNLEENPSLYFLAHCICRNWELADWGGITEYYEKNIWGSEAIISDIFLDNMKTVTPWVIKAVNIELLLDFVRTKNGAAHILHVATHLSNLLKVSERVAVRHSAGKALLTIAPLLTRDQRNEVAIELWKGLETGEYEFSKYIPQYLGEFVLYLYPMELDEFVRDLSHLMISSNDRVVCVALDTLGILLQHYRVYRDRFAQREDAFEERKKMVLGMLLSGLANYTASIHQEAFLVISRYLFASNQLSLEEKKEFFSILCKKLVTLVSGKGVDELTFFNSAASLNHIYRFISDYLFAHGSFSMEEKDRVAFFPGTFDPFSLSHKEIAREIRDLGFVVYLALDEFSWSKKTQPRMIRRQISMMSIANEADIYMFPDDLSVNIANPKDLKKLRELFAGKELYVVVGSDVVENASSYKKRPVKDSIHTMNHIIFLREGGSDTREKTEGEQLIRGKKIKLKLPVYLEDISSTRIRENVDCNRDISNLIDPVAQNFIYENSLYLREPQYKPILQAKTVRLTVEGKVTDPLAEEILKGFGLGFDNMDGVKRALQRKGASAAILRDEGKGNVIAGTLFFCQISTTELYGEFRDTKVVNYIRQNTSGKMMLISGIFLFGQSDAEEREQLLLTEALAYCLKNDFTYCIYTSNIMAPPETVRRLLGRYGFLQLSLGQRHIPQDAAMEPAEGMPGSITSGTSYPVYTVDMKSPVAVFKNIETSIKDPFKNSARVRRAIDHAHHHMQESLAALYPGSLVISFDASVMHHKLVRLITAANNVPEEPLPVRKLGESMCVPFGKILRGVALPNTVTKALHTEKTFDPEIGSFRITEYPNYSPLENQIRTIKSFNRSVILVDDLLHKGYRIRELDPLFKKEKVQIGRIVVGLLSGRGKDLMAIQNRKVESVYFLPNLRLWFVESTMYPFIGGDMVQRPEKRKGNQMNSINMILPYVMPGFMRGTSKEAVYDFSMVCLENARDILKALEEEYQECFERKLTLNRLGEVIIAPTCPDRGSCLGYDNHLAASIYVANDIENLKRLKHFLSE